MMFCDTPYQSLFVGILGGLLATVVGLSTQVLLVGVVVGGLFAILGEIALHEYRKDEQYVEAKQEFQEIFS